MTKEEKIKEAYGKHWEIVKNIVDKNGFIWQSTLFFPETEMIDKIEIQVKSFYPDGRCKWRPKSLQGIENNNNWIKIESENDLPTNTEAYHHGIMNGEVICFKLQHPLNLKRLYKDFHKDNVTHYQEISKPKPPTY